jgi:hypothetical protein
VRALCVAVNPSLRSARRRESIERSAVRGSILAPADTTACITEAGEYDAVADDIDRFLRPYGWTAAGTSCSTGVSSSAATAG